MAAEPGYRGRFAPSPTGPLHFGSLVAALGSWLRARSLGGQWLLRIEDIDPPRELAGAAAGQLRTLERFGLHADGEVLWQGSRAVAYAAALERLVAAGLAYPCHCSRVELAPFGGRHPPACVARDRSRPAAMRMRVPAEEIGFDDLIQGRFRQRLDVEVGDFVVRRVEGWFAYQLAVVVDDAAQRITEVLRGSDLLDSTPRQILLQRALGLPTPAYAHLPVVVDADGRKLGKSLAALPVDPGDPLPALRTAWRFLGQPADVLPQRAPVERWLQAAVAGFRFEAIPRREALPAPGGDMSAV